MQDVVKARSALVLESGYLIDLFCCYGVDLRMFQQEKRRFPDKYDKFIIPPHLADISKVEAN